MGSRPKQRRGWSDVGVSLRGSPQAPRSSGGGLLATVDRMIRSGSGRRSVNATVTDHGFEVDVTGLTPSEDAEGGIEVNLPALGEGRSYICAARFTVAGGEATKFIVVVAPWGAFVDPGVSASNPNNVGNVPFQLPPTPGLGLLVAFAGTGTASVQIVGYAA